jgi:hypothetical protein
MSYILCPGIDGQTLLVQHLRHGEVPDPPPMAPSRVQVREGSQPAGVRLGGVGSQPVGIQPGESRAVLTTVMPTDFHHGNTPPPLAVPLRQARAGIPERQRGGGHPEVGPALPQSRRTGGAAPGGGEHDETSICRIPGPASRTFCAAEWGLHKDGL